MDEKELNQAMEMPAGLQNLGTVPYLQFNILISVVFFRIFAGFFGVIIPHWECNELMYGVPTGTALIMLIEMPS